MHERGSRIAPANRFLTILAACAIAHCALAQDGDSKEEAMDALRRHIEVLEARIRQLEDRLEAPLTVKAPFQVVDGAGTPIIRVSAQQDNYSRGIYLFDTSSQVVVSLANAGGGTGGLVRVMRGGDLASRVSLAAYGNELGLHILRSDQEVTFLGERDFAGRFELYGSDGKMAAELGSAEGKRTALRILDGGGNQVAAIGMDADGNGTVRAGSASGYTAAELKAMPNGGGQVAVHLPNGRPAAALFVDRGAGAVDVYDSGGTALGSLTKGQNGGILQLFSLSGETMVEAGTGPANVGVVRTGPMSRGTAAALGTPGSYILGKR